MDTMDTRNTRYTRDTRDTRNTRNTRDTRDTRDIISSFILSPILTNTLVVRFQTQEPKEKVLPFVTICINFPNKSLESTIWRILEVQFI